MGIRLMVEVMEHAPASLTWKERYLLLVIAESARDATRLCIPRYEGEQGEQVKRRARMGRSQFYAAIKELVDKGALEHHTRGCNGNDAQYRIPVLAAVDNPVKGPENPDAKGSSKTRTEGSGKPGLLPISTPQFPSIVSVRGAIRLVIEATDADEDEATEVVERIQRKHKPRASKLSGYIRAMAKNGDLTPLVEQVRSERQRQAVAAAVAQARRGPKCEHGDPGGASPHPVTGEPLCAICRDERRVSA